MKFLFLLLLCSSVWAGPPAAAWEYQSLMQGSAWNTFGPGAPVATLAAQIHQESAWKCDAVSWAGAGGCAQFMPGTEKDMARRFPAQCAPANRFSPPWAFTCRDLYLKTMLKGDSCSDMAFALRGYNGGWGWVRRDQRLTAENGFDPTNWQHVALFNAGRRESAFKENTEYPVRIFKLETMYASWGGAMECSI